MEQTLTPVSPVTTERISTGIDGLDEILHGGLVAGRAYLLRGGPGAGKTTLGLHFLTRGVALGEESLFITLEEPEAHIRQNAAGVGLNLDGVRFLDLSPTSEFFAEAQTYDIFSAAEVEREPITTQIVNRLEEVRPRRVFLDPITQFRYLSSDVYQFRKQVLSFLRLLVDYGATVLFTSEGSAGSPDDDLQFMSDGVITLDCTDRRRTITVTKCRGTDFYGGAHTMRITGEGIQVRPRLLPRVHHPVQRDLLGWGVPELDELFMGGIRRGTITLITGPSGVGKTTLGLQFMKEAAGRGERSVVYSFEEETDIILARCESINIPARTMQEQGTLSLVKIEPDRHTPDEFAYMVRTEVERNHTRVVMIDSTSGYQLSMQGDNLLDHLYGLSKYLQNMGVVVLLVTETEEIVGTFKVSEVGINYMTDAVVFLRYLEIEGEMRKTIGVLKNRLSDFEKNLREFRITRYGIKVGAPLTRLRNVLSGVPEWVDEGR